MSATRLVWDCGKVCRTTSGFSTLSRSSRFLDKFARSELLAVCSWLPTLELHFNLRRSCCLVLHVESNSPISTGIDSIEYLGTLIASFSGFYLFLSQFKSVSVVLFLRWLLIFEVYLCVCSGRATMPVVEATHRVDRFSKKDIIVSPSILSANFAYLGDQVRQFYFFRSFGSFREFLLMLVTCLMSVSMRSLCFLFVTYQSLIANVYFLDVDAMYFLAMIFVFFYENHKP